MDACIDKGDQSRKQTVAYQTADKIALFAGSQVNEFRIVVKH